MAVYDVRFMSERQEIGTAGVKPFACATKTQLNFIQNQIKKNG